MEAPINDVETRVCTEIMARKTLGLKKYGMHLCNNPAALGERMQHQFEELLDAAIYTRWAMDQVEALTAERDALVALSHPKSNLADSGVIAAPVAGAHPAKGTSALPFPARIMDQLQEIARREDSEHHGPWTDGEGEPLQDDADAAIAWIKAAAPVVPAPVAKPRLIGWRTSDFLMETADKAMAQNWEVHHEMLPIFEGDSYTSLQAAPVAQLSEPPAGWKLVPIVPTPKMLNAPSNCYQADALITWHEMLAAAPTTPKE